MRHVRGVAVQHTGRLSAFFGTDTIASPCSDKDLQRIVVFCSYGKYSLMQSFYEKVYEITTFLSQITLHKNAWDTEDFSH